MALLRSGHGFPTGPVPAPELTPGMFLGEERVLEVRLIEPIYLSDGSAALSYRADDMDSSVLVSERIVHVTLRDPFTGAHRTTGFYARQGVFARSANESAAV